jgi:hypothetical protein
LGILNESQSQGTGITPPIRTNLVFGSDRRAATPFATEGLGCLVLAPIARILFDLAG